MSTLLALLVLGRVGTDDGPQEAPEPRVTIWARAGGVGWSECEAHVRLASEFEGATLATTHANAVSAWTERAGRCPHAPAVLAVAARIELARRVDLEPLDAGIEALPEIVEAYRRQRAQARRWMEVALLESRRRGAAAPRAALYHLAQIHLSLGDLVAGRRALARAALDGSQPVAAWDLDLTRALFALLEGDLEVALRRAHAGLRDAPKGEQTREASYVLAYVLDRVGSWDEAAALLRQLRRLNRDGRGLWAMDGVLPLREKIYLRALDHHANGELGPALHLYAAYMAHPAVAMPERRLAERHLRALEPTAPLVGGPGR